MKITLTFDNGPDPEVTQVVLSCLRERNIAATFFVLGKNIAVPELRDLAVAARDAGHRIGNHTFTHESPLGLMDDEAAIGQIEDTQRLLGDLAGTERLFRPVGRQGRIGPHMLKAGTWDHLLRGQYTCVLWNCLAEEWLGPHDWVERTIERCRAQEWSVVVLHDLPTGAIDHLAEFLDILIAEGAEFSQEFPDDTIACRAGVALPPARDIVALADS